MELNFPTLTADQIEVKIKQCSEKGAVALLYKTARTDISKPISRRFAMAQRARR